MDSGFLYALIDDADAHNLAVRSALEAVFEKPILPVPAITETAYFVAKYLGPTAHADFIQSIPDMKIVLEIPTDDDYLRSGEILRKYNDANIDFVDACIVAMAERLNIAKILTVDRRHFQMFRPAHCKAFEILP